MPQSIRPGERRVTITDVAKAANVSSATVSLALNGSPRISVETRQRVERCARALRYQPNHAAASLRTQVTRTIALAVPDIGNPVYIEIARTVQQIARQRAYHLHLISTESQPSEEVHALETLAQRSVDGLIMISLHGASALDASLREVAGPVVIIGHLQDVICDNVTVASAAGAALAIQHLWAVGCSALAFVNGPAGTWPSSEREKGVQNALRAADQTISPVLRAEEDFTTEGGHRAAQHLLAQGVCFDGLLCANDLMAIGAMRALRAHGLRIPEDVAVIGMDDIRECQFTTPPLSSVSLMAGERGRLAAQLLFDRLGGDSGTLPRQLTVSPVLMPRGSTTPRRTPAARDERGHL
ncbi:LacI family transcriptional regulator [Deinococcus aerolatus]|uniref:LacI family transcriptional regulator n=1 Tax=Deinococcus aerolatus TaxID=522487 RepID=A0ABQ2GHA8_9DEIO|nr:LacI family DNA-binding transcriptional regulator [Deinococcus aerolatus]GGL95255.1 LacI family transcriptional regulator [Deinococcus aerolatus]